MPMSSQQMTQAGITFSISGVAVYYMWDRMEIVSKGLVVIFALVACMSIQQGTWMQNHRDMRRRDRDNRRETYREAKKWLGFGKGQKES